MGHLHCYQYARTRVGGGHSHLPGTYRGCSDMPENWSLGPTLYRLCVVPSLPRCALWRSHPGPGYMGPVAHQGSGYANILNS